MFSRRLFFRSENLIPHPFPGGRRGEPAAFGINQDIAGWTEGAQLMDEGAKYKFYIPWQLAYGEHGAGASIPPYAALIFTVELLEVL